MRYLVALIAVILAFPAAASARTPASVVAYVTPTAGADIRCATTQAEWDGIVRTSGLPYGLYWGFTWIDRRQMQLSPFVCKALNGTNIRQRGRALNILGHEATHLAGYPNEQYAACRGLYWAPILAHKVFGVKYHTALMREYVAGSRTQHELLSPSYRTGPGACA